ncbi:NUDIX hydrolase [Candidatus Woesearchaeota archaeon]|nr:NUDIX hydrolase [Candidatus Woesearchaeota archaeon]
MKKNDIAVVMITNKNKILLHRAHYPPKFFKLDLVGGHVNKGESLEHAAVREAKEETGFKVILQHKLFTHEIETQLLHVFSASIHSGKLRTNLEGKPMWVDLNHLPLKKLAFKHTLDILERFKNHTPHSTTLHKPFKVAN